MMNSNTLIHGKRIVAMNADNTSVTQMLHMLGVEPTSEVVAEFMAQGQDLTMSTLHAFLVSKGIMSDAEGVVADVRGVAMEPVAPVAEPAEPALEEPIPESEGELPQA